MSHTQNSLRFPRTFYLTNILLLVGLFFMGELRSEEFPIIGVHPESQKWAESCQARIKKLKNTLPKIKPGPNSVRKIGEANAEFGNLVRDARILLHCGEPAAVDYYYEALSLKKQIVKLVGQSRGRKVTANALDYYSSSKITRQGRVDRAKQMFAESKLPAGEKEIRKLWDDANSYVMFLDRRFEQELGAQIRPADTPIFEAMRKTRVSLAKSSLSKLIGQESLGVAKFRNDSTKALAQVKSSGKSEAFGESLDGPATLRKVMGQWKAAHATMLRLNALQTMVQGCEVELTSIKDDKKFATAVMTSELQTFQENMTKSIIDTVLGDLQKASENEKLDKYTGYLTALSDPTLSFESSNLQKIKTAFSSAINQGTQVGDLIGNYNRATGEMLKWRERFANSKAQAELAAKTATFSSLEKFPMASPRITRSVAENIEDMKTKLVGMETLTRDMFAGENGIHSSLSNGCWVKLTSSPSLEAKVNGLKADLFAEKLPPLNLDAAMSVSGAVNGNYSAVVGNITNVDLASYVGALFNSNEQNATSIIGLSRQPVQSLIDFSIIKFEVEPTTVYHSHFVAPVSQ